LDGVKKIFWLHWKHMHRVRWIWHTQSTFDDSYSLHFGIHRCCGYWSTNPFTRMTLFTLIFGHVGVYVIPYIYTKNCVSLFVCLFVCLFVVCLFVFHTLPHLSPVSIIFVMMAGNIRKELLGIWKFLWSFEIPSKILFYCCLRTIRPRILRVYEFDGA
jgi:hypothetical protein